jgi:predicted nuclease of predicted toxin-antitoxin system
MPTHLLLADEDFWVQVVDRLRAIGHDVRRVREFDDNKSGDGRTDEEVLELAKKQRRAVVTFNRKDFQKLHNDHPDHHGVILCYQDDPEAESLATRIDQQIRAMGSLRRQLVRVAKAVPKHHLKQQEKARKRREKRPDR